MVDDEVETQNQGGKKKDITCFSCEKTGHYSNECFRKHFLSQVKNMDDTSKFLKTNYQVQGKMKKLPRMRNRALHLNCKRMGPVIQEISIKDYSRNGIQCCVLP